MNVIQKKQSEKATALGLGESAIGRHVSVAEEAQAEGHYSVICRGPKEEFRADYIRLVTGAAAFASRGNTTMANELLAIAEEMLEIKWEEPIENLVTTVGKNDALDKYLAGAGYTAAWYVGLISSTGYTTGPAAGDTSASHAGWAEDTNYSNGTRVAPSFAGASGGSKATSSAAVFNMNGVTTIKGCFLITNSTKGGATGILYSAGLFTGGDKTVGNGDTLNVSYTASL